MLAVAEERDERGLGIAPGRERAVVHARAGGRVGGRRRRLRAERPPCARVRSRKLRASVRPCSVEIDSGWNWTPHCGRVRCSSPMTTPSGVHAVTRSSAGQSATTSEW